METVTAHCYSWAIVDGQGGEDTSDEDANVQIRAWCLDRDSNPYLLRINNFPVLCYIELPQQIAGRHKVWDRNALDTFFKYLQFCLGDDKPSRYIYREAPKIYLYDHLNGQRPMMLVAFNTVKAMTHCEHFLAKPKKVPDLGLVNCKVWETSISIVRKLLSQKKCGFSQWFTAQGEKVDPDLSLSTLEREYMVDWATLTPLSAEQTSGWTSHPRVLAVDIETYSDNHRAFPNKYHALHVAYMLSAIYQQVGHPETRQRYVIVLGECEDLSEDGIEVICVKTELQLIKAFGDLVQKLDPEIISGYNIMGFDFSYLNARLERRGHEWPNMSRLKDGKTFLKSKVWKSSAYGHNKIDILQMDGRISIDMLPLVKRDYKLDKYDLDFVSKNFLGDQTGKHDVKAPEMFAIYEELSRTRKLIAELERSGEKVSSELREEYQKAKTNFTKVTRYCVQDSELVIELFEKLNVWIALVELSNIVGVSIMELFTSGQQIRCISQVYDLAASLGVVIDKREMKKVHFSGGFVFEPIPGLYENIICLDFSSLYPSIMMAFNICHSTLVPPELEDIIPDEDCNIIEFDQEEEDIDPEDEENENSEDETGKLEAKSKTKKPPVIKHYRYKFVKEHIRKGILPQLVKKLVDERRKVRRQLDGVKDENGAWLIAPEADPITRIILDKRQLALKVSANSMFGFLGAQGGKLPLIEGARCITAIGRMLITKVNEYLEQRYGARVVYNDTDSSMVDLGIKDPREANQWGIRLAQEISGVKKGQKLWNGEVATEDIKGLFPPPLGMEFEKAMRLLCLKKKKYAAFFVLKDGSFKRDKKGEIEILKRGIVLARRDNCKLLRRVYNDVLLKILHRRGLNEAMEIIVDSVQSLLRGEISYKELLVVREVGNYAADSTYFMKTFADELRRIGKPVQPGDRIEYLVTNVEGVEKVGLKMRSVETYLENLDAGTPDDIDYFYYLEKQLKNPLDQLVEIGYQETFKRIDAHFGKNIIGYKPKGTKKFVPLSKPIKLIHKMLQDGQDIGVLKNFVDQVLNALEPPKLVIIG